MDIENRLPFCDNLDACTGCAACAAVCPERCIAMQPNSEGFLIPVIDSKRCTHCERCVKICPVNSQRSFDEENNPDQVPLGVFAAWHLNEAIRQKSSSGGVFTALAENILNKGGVVIGAAFDEQLTVKHMLVDSAADLYRLRSSKYVQSEVCPDIYHQTRKFLDDGRFVLFSGTPCQMAGFRSFFRRPEPNLFCCDLICHGVPSPLLFKRYVQQYIRSGKPLADITFRDKTNGWKGLGVRQYFKNGKIRLLTVWKDPFMAAFLYNYALRECCYACDFKMIKHQSDLTIADFWGVTQKYPEYDPDNAGTSLVLVNNEKGNAWLDACRTDLFLGSADLDTAVKGNPNLIRSCDRPSQRDAFYGDLNSFSFNSVIRKYKLRPPLLRRVVSTIKSKLIASVRLKGNIGKIAK